MYERLTINTGVAAVAQYHSIFDIQSSTDGVTFASPDKNNYFSDVYMPDTLRTWLMDIRLLRHIPIAYFVPDAALLPPESIRFFNIDPTWMDRVVDGVFAAANTGTVDSVFSASMLAMTRDAIDADLFTAADDLIPGNGWNPSDGMTGMLIRSELVRRWPDMIIRAFKKELDDDVPSRRIPSRTSPSSAPRPSPRTFTSPSSPERRPWSMCVSPTSAYASASKTTPRPRRSGPSTDVPATAVRWPVRSLCSRATFPTAP